MTDLDYAGDLSITVYTVQNAEDLLRALEEAAACVDLHYNETKTEFIFFIPDASVSTFSGKVFKCVNDFKHLRSYIMNSVKDFITHKVEVWDTCNKLNKIWRSNLSNNIKPNLFKAVILQILLYGSETWTLRAKEIKRVDGCYTNLLMRVQNVS